MDRDWWASGFRVAKSWIKLRMHMCVCTRARIHTTHEIIQCLSFSQRDWLISLSIMPSRSIHIVTSSKIFCFYLCIPYFLCPFFCWWTLGIFTDNNMSSANADNLTSSPIWMLFISFPCLLALAKDSSTRLNRSGDNGILFVPDLGEKGFTFSLLSMMLTVGWSYTSLWFNLYFFVNFPVFFLL